MILFRRIRKKTKDGYMKDNRRKKKGMPTDAKFGIAFVIELILIGVLVIFLGKQYVHEKYEKVIVNDLEPEELEINEGVDEEEIKGYTTIALFGVDTRGGDLGAGSRSDSIIVASINNDTKKVKLVSVYRDTMLEVQNAKKSTVKCNAAYAYGGPEMAIQTLNANLDLSITEYITVNWEGLTRAIDAMGGVTVHIEEEEIPKLNQALAEQIATNGISSDGVYQTGDVTLNGAQATAYARIRKLSGGDIARTERQREILSGLIAKAKTMNMSQINSVIDEIFPYVSTSITEDEMISLATHILSYELEGTMGFPVKYAFYSSNPSKGACIAAQNLEDNVIALHKFFYNNEEYTATDNVQRISHILENETGVKSKGEVEVPSE